MSFGRPPSINIGSSPLPPDRGSFPLDHYGLAMPPRHPGTRAQDFLGECKEQMLVYMKCLKENSSNSTPCRALSRSYLDCRMRKGLMERDDWSNLGLDKVDGQKARDEQHKSVKS